MSLLARDRKLSPPITGLLLSIPPVINPDRVPERFREAFLSYEQNADAPILSRSSAYEASSTSTKWRDRPGQRLIANCGVTGLYHGDQDSFMTWPILHPQGHSRLPPTYLQICGMDPLRDDGLIFEQVLRESGVRTKIDIYPGLPHGFWVIFPQLLSSKKQVADTMAGVAWLLGSK